MFYGATVILLAGLAARIWNAVRHPARLKTEVNPSDQGALGGTMKLAGEVMLFRSTFFSDRWNWVFRTLFHFGLLLVLVRHLRYSLDPSWVGGVFWKAVVIVQPFGLYGGLALLGGTFGFFARRVLFRAVRRGTGLVDNLLLLVLLLVPVTGYLCNFFHTDVVAVKSFFVGLASGHLRPLPTDGLLLVHLWLVAVLMVLLPFGKMLHFADIFEKVRTEAEIQSGLMRKAKLATAGLLTLVMLVPAVIGAGQVAADGWTAPQPDFTKLLRGHRKDPTQMVRNHPDFLMHKLDVTVYSGVRSSDDTLERCVTCHAVKDAAGQPVDADNPKHFCNECHAQAAVTIDCFECHNSKGITSGQADLGLPTKLAAIKQFFAERSAVR